jgi:hypothetical protein
MWKAEKSVVCRLTSAGLFEIPSLLQYTNAHSPRTYFINNITDEFVSFWQLRWLCLIRVFNYCALHCGFTLLCDVCVL